MEALPTLDAHGHLIASKAVDELSACGAVLAMTLSPEEAESALGRDPDGCGGARRDPLIVWGAGCHPGKEDAQAGFDPEGFRRLAERTAVLGEIGLDKASRAPLQTQLRTFRAVLKTAADLGRIVSIHSMHATALALDELERTRVPAAILHWWLGSAAETSRAVALGCYFSIHSAIARYSKFRTRVPVERVLCETDHGYLDPPAAIPARIEWVEHLAAQQYKLDVSALRVRVWKNFGELVRRTGTVGLLPGGMRDLITRTEAM